MRLCLCIPLLCSSLFLVSSALEMWDFPIYPADDAAEDMFSLEEPVDNTLLWDDTLNENSDSSFLLASDCSVSFPRKRVRRGDPADFCSAPTRSTADEGQKGGNEHSGPGSSDDTVDSSTPLDEIFSIPRLSPYPHERHDDCFRLTNGQLPLAVCDLGGGSDYFINGQVYRDLLYSYPGKEMHHFSHLPFFPSPTYFWREGFNLNPSYHPIELKQNTHVSHWLVPFNSVECPFTTTYCCASFDGISSSKKCRPLALLNGWKGRYLRFQSMDSRTDLSISSFFFFFWEGPGVRGVFFGFF